jgi:hypothetical protein
MSSPSSEAASLPDALGEAARGWLQGSPGPSTWSYRRRRGREPV